MSLRTPLYSSHPLCVPRPLNNQRAPPNQQMRLSLHIYAPPLGQPTHAACPCRLLSASLCTPCAPCLSFVWQTAKMHASDTEAPEARLIKLQPFTA